MDQKALVDLMIRAAEAPDQLASMGEASRSLIGEWGTERFASGVFASTELALGVGPLSAGIVNSVLLSLSLGRGALSRNLS
jgi:hypothetical protein